MKETSAVMALVLVAAFLMAGLSAGSPGSPPETSSRSSPLLVEIALPDDNATYKAGSSVMFIGWSSAIRDGNFDHFSWVLLKDGTYWMNISTKDEIFVMTLNDTATYTVRLIAYDLNNDSAISEIQVKVITSSYEPPVPIINCPQENQTFNDDRASYFFNGSDSYDPNGGKIDFYYWYGFYHYWDGPAPEHWEWQSMPAGHYYVTLTVTGADGLMNTTIRHFNVEYSGNNTPPVPVINSPKNNETFPVNTSVKFSSYDSYDPDGSIVNRTWNISLGGALLNTVVNEVNFTYVFPVEAMYRIELSVTDNGSKERNIWIDVQIGGENQPLVARITVADDFQNLTFPVNYSIRFFGNGSYAPEGTQLAFQWFIAGSPAGNASEMTIAFSAPGDLTITLEVSDGILSATTSVDIHIYQQASPEISVPPGQKDVHFADGALTARAGTGILFEGRGSAGSIPLNMSWDFGDGTNGTGISVTHVYPKPGKYSVTYSVKDGYSTRTAQLVVNVRASPQVVAASSPYATYAVLAIAVVAVVGFAAFIGGTELGIGLLFPFLIYLYSKVNRDEILDNFIRGRISGYIVANPGENYSAIRDALKLSNGATAFHLRKLEHEEVIKSTSDGVYRRFFPAEMRLPENNGGSLTQVQRMVFDKIVETPGITQKDIAGILNVSSQTIGYHVNALIKKCRIRRVRTGIRVRYFPEETTFENA